MRYLIVGLICSILSFPAFAELKIGFVNAIKVMDEAPQLQKASKALEAEFSRRKRKLVSANNELKKMEEKFRKNSAIMNETKIKQESRKIRDLKRDLKRQQEEIGEDFNIRRSEELDKVQKVIIDVIQEIAKQGSYDFILSEGVVWASEQVDITDQVLKKLVKKLKKR
ncbi:OmpH family outer membrane protein [Thiotrichales bacterium HSG1]|nr:OmpH family outer membrane protein [Thiotrichales bacterium HSG1]